jgi:hypothetical protein
MLLNARRAGRWLAVAVLSCVLSTDTAAQRQGQRAQGPEAVPIVEVVGCLTQSASNAWIVANATEPTQGTTGWSKPEEVKAAEAKAIGTRQFPLIGLVELSPAEHKGHKVVVKGMLIKDAGTTRLNVTSLMTAAVTCAK